MNARTQKLRRSIPSVESMDRRVVPSSLGAHAGVHVLMASSVVGTTTPTANLVGPFIPGRPHNLIGIGPTTAFLRSVMHPAGTAVGTTTPTGNVVGPFIPGRPHNLIGIGPTTAFLRSVIHTAAGTTGGTTAPAGNVVGPFIPGRPHNLTGIGPATAFLRGFRF